MAESEKMALSQSLEGQQNSVLFALYKSYFSDLIDATQSCDIDDLVYCNDAMSVIENLLATRGIKLERV